MFWILPFRRNFSSPDLRVKGRDLKAGGLHKKPKKSSGPTNFMIFSSIFFSDGQQAPKKSFFWRSMRSEKNIRAAVSKNGFACFSKDFLQINGSVPSCPTARKSDPSLSLP